MSLVSRRAIAGSLVLSALLPALAANAQTGSTYPDRAIKLIVPFPPGGGSDFLARLLAQKMSETLRQPIVVDNKPGRPAPSEPTPPPRQHLTATRSCSWCVTWASTPAPIPRCHSIR